MPIQCEYYALEGLGQLLRNVSLVQQNINPGLRLSGIVMTMFDPRTKLSEQVVEEVQRYFGALVYDIIIPRTVRLSEAPGFGQPITVYDPKSKGAACYRELGREVALRPPPAEPMPSFDDLPTLSCRHRRSPAPGEPSTRRSSRIPTFTAPRGARRSPSPPSRSASRTEPGRTHPDAMPTAAEPEPCRSPRPCATRAGAEPGPKPNPSPCRISEPSPTLLRRMLDEEDVWEARTPQPSRRRVAPPAPPRHPGTFPNAGWWSSMTTPSRPAPGPPAADRGRARRRPRRGRYRRHARGRGGFPQTPMATVPQGRRVMSKRGGLGRGLSALIPGAPEAGEGSRAARGAG